MKHKKDCKINKRCKTAKETEGVMCKCSNTKPCPLIYLCTCLIEKGQEVLIKDLEELLAEVKVGEFGDFTNKKYPAPKVALREKLLELSENVIKGKYD